MSRLIWHDALARMYRRVADTAAELGAADDRFRGFPHYADPVTGAWTLSPDGDWTGGFWVAMLWLAAAGEGSPRWRELAQAWARRLEPRVLSDSVFRGFLFYYGAALGEILLSDLRAGALALDGAWALSRSFSRAAGVLPLGQAAEEASDVGAGEANVDSVQASALLLWAAEQTGEARLREPAVSHALRHIEFCLRDDGSVCQSASFDPRTGIVTRRYTHKGISDTSTWARAQAWGMLGWAMTFARCGDPRMLAAAERAADWWCRRVPADRVAFWDFDDPAAPATNRDTSATAIAAAALLKLGQLSPSNRERWLSAGTKTVTALVEHYLTPAGILAGGCYNRRLGLATSHELVWGSYYLFEALHVLNGKLNAAAI